MISQLGPDLAVVKDGDRTIIAGEPDAVASSLADLSTPGFWIGFVSYEYGSELEHVSTLAPLVDVPRIFFARYGARFVVDAASQDSWYEGAPVAVAALRKRLEHPNSPSGPETLSSSWESLTDRHSFMKSVEVVKEHLIDGDCYQVNLTRQILGPVLRPTDIFQAMWMQNPAPHPFFLATENFWIAGASPELFLRVEGNTVITKPMKGTARNRADLASSLKDRAENLIVVDLARNDLGKLARYGSVRVLSLFEIEDHPGLAQMTSTVGANLNPDWRWTTLLNAMLPPASITGAPKPSVMRIISQLETSGRGVYCGCAGWVDSEKQRAKLSVSIRTFVGNRDVTTLGIGAGIVIDSDPEKEWEETELKANRLLSIAAGLDSVAR